MNQHMVFADYLVFVLYFIIVTAYGFNIYRKRKKGEHDAKAFFLAEGTLTWWAIGASLIASNISAEQFIGMSGEGFFLGVAVAAYEWIAAIALIIVAVWFIPVYLKNHIYTMPQFLKTRYNETVALIMAIFWLFLYVFVNLTSILYLGAVAINGLAGGQYLHVIMLGLAIFALLISLGGMKVVAYTDVIQVAVLIIGGLVTTYIALDVVGDRLVGEGSGPIAGFKALLGNAPEHFKMIIPKPNTASDQNAISKYITFPGVLSYAAGIWIINLNYWGCNQYITQRALGADLQTARTGILFAGFLKLMMPIIVMLPGIAAFVLYKSGHLPQLLGGKDGAYSAMLTFLPTGLKGLSVAALTAAIVASLAGKVNSISTIFTLDVYKKYIKKESTEKNMVITGRVTVFVALILAVMFTWSDLLGIGGEGGFTFIQKYTGFISPGVFAMFVLGMFWKRTTGLAAIVGVVAGFVFSVFFNEMAPKVLGEKTFLYTAYPALTTKNIENERLLNEQDQQILKEANAATPQNLSSSSVFAFAKYDNGKPFSAVVTNDKSDDQGYCASKNLLDSFFIANPNGVLESFIISKNSTDNVTKAPSSYDKACQQTLNFEIQNHKPFKLIIKDNSNRMVIYDHHFEIPFHICMGLSFLFTVIIMVALSMAGPKINPKAFELDKAMFKVSPSTLALIVVTLLLIAALYVKFW